MSVEIQEREGLFVRQTLDLDDGTNFHSAPTAGRNASGDVDGFVKVLGVDQKEAASCSRVSANGPSVTTRLPSLTRTLVAVEVG